jgi:DNA-binding GntR family transcriptional regulator
MDELIAGLLRRVDRYWALHGVMLKHRGIFEREHRAILAALYDHNAAAAGELLEAHLAGAAGLLIGEIARVDAAVAGATSDEP